MAPRKKDVPRILLTDRWDTWHRLLKNLLVDDYHVEAISTLAQAIDTLRKSDPPYHVVITDIQFTTDPVNDLIAGRHAVLDEIFALESYTKPIVAVSHGATPHQVHKMLTNYEIDPRYCIDKFPPVDRYSSDDYRAFDARSFQNIVGEAANTASDEEKRIHRQSDHEQLQRIIRERFHVLPLVEQGLNPNLYIALLTPIEISISIDHQISLAIDSLRRRSPALRYHCVPYGREREREKSWLEINEAGLVIADLTGQDPDLFYEVGLCDALAKQIIFLVDESRKADVPTHLNPFRRVTYDSDKWGITELSSQLMDELIDGPPPGHPLGKPRWGLSDIDRQMILTLLPRANATLSEHEADVVENHSDICRSFVGPVLRLREFEVREPSGIFGSRAKAEAIWRALNRAGVILADITVADPEILYMVGLAHAQSKPTILLTSNKQAIPLSLQGLDYFEYSLDWDSPAIVRKQAELGAKIDNLLDAYGTSTGGFDQGSSQSIRQAQLIWEDWGWQSSDGSEVISQGAVRDILVGLGDRLPDESFSRKNRDLICSMASSHEDRRVQTAVRLWETLWVEEAGLPHVPFMRILAKDELSAKMYSEYRDHVVHSVWVYLLGLYLYERNGPIRAAILGRMEEEDFLLAWKITALFHDIGYTCDKGIDQEASFLQPVLDELQALTDSPLRAHLEARGFKLSERDEVDLARVSSRFTPRLLTLDSIEFMPAPGPEQRLLRQIEPLVIHTQLAQETEETPLQNYYNLGKTVKPNNRERFRDHGILSALILLHQFHFFTLCLQSLQVKTLPKSISRRTLKELSSMISASAAARHAKIVHEAAAAIALHNINVEIWDIEMAKQSPHNLSLADFQISLDESPLAFLLALTDVLQCWDRPKRRYVHKAEGLSVRNQDVRIFCVGDLIQWAVRHDAMAGKKLVDPGEEIKALSAYMSYQGRKDLSPLVREEEF